METIKLTDQSPTQPKPDRNKLMLVGGAIFLLVCLIYGTECRHEAKSAQQAFEQQKNQNKADREQAYAQGFMAGANVSLNTMGEAMGYMNSLQYQALQGSNVMAQLTQFQTNAQEYVRSNIVWNFNLMRPK